MLLNLNIKNYALINDLTVNFSDDFTVISGDTGSGKSIILDALSILLGSRVDKKKINTDKCVIEASFKINSDIEYFFNKYDLDFDEITLLRREINQSGKIRNFINDTPVTANVLSNFSSLIIEIHAQHHNLLIKNKSEQLSVIDTIANNSDLLSSYKDILKQYIQQKDILTEFSSKMKLNDDDYDLYKFHYQEILDANIKINEELEIEKKINLFENINQIKEISQQSNQLLAGDNKVIDFLNQIKNSISKYENFNELEERINSSIIDLNDISSEFDAISENLNNSSINLSELLNRFDLINNILRKHKLKSSSELESISSSIKFEIDKYENFDKEKKLISDKLNQLYKLLEKKSELLSASRKKVSNNFEKDIKNLLITLGMPYASFKVKFNRHNEFKSNGIDDVVFQFSSNPGVLEQDISKIASGGEISRLVLALKYITSKKNAIKTIIFDEIDTGVSGKIASFMGDLMRSISKKTQLISVTHLPQIASKSSIHIKVFKTTNENKSKTEVKNLDKDERVLEIARLLSGRSISDAAISNAKELLNQ